MNSTNRQYLSWVVPCVRVDKPADELAIVARKFIAWIKWVACQEELSLFTLNCFIIKANECLACISSLMKGGWLLISSSDSSTNSSRGPAISRQASWKIGVTIIVLSFLYTNICQHIIETQALCAVGAKIFYSAINMFQLIHGVTSGNNAQIMIGHTIGQDTVRLWFAVDPIST